MGNSKTIVVLCLAGVAGTLLWIFTREWRQPNLVGNSGSGGIIPKAVMQPRQVSTPGSPLAAELQHIVIPQEEDGVAFLQRLHSAAVNDTNALSFEDALAWPEKFSKRTQYITAITAIISHRGIREPMKLLKWFNEKVSSGDVDAEIRRSVAHVLGGTDSLDEAGLKSLCNDTEFGKAFFESSARQFPQKLATYLDNLNAHPSFDRYAFAAASGILESERIAESLAVSSKIADVEMRASVAGSACFQWALEKPQEAVAWVESIKNSDPAIAAKVTGSLVSGWYQHDPEAASNWANSLPEGDMKDYARISLVTELVRESPSEAKVWAATIKDTELRDKTMAMIQVESNRLK